MSHISEAIKETYSIGFYNLENLFDTLDNPKTLDDDFTPESDRQWTEKRLRKKLKKLGRIISNIGYKDITHPPILLGVAEVENAQVLERLIQSKFLKDKGYQYVHFDSPDERGIDTALLYREEYVQVIDKEAITLYVENEHGERDFTRDILRITVSLKGQIITILVNHWPSRRSGSDETAYKRIAAAEKNLEVIRQIRHENPEAKIIVMGDFNDDPQSKSVQLLSSEDMYNPMEVLLTKDQGSLNHNLNWYLFDQMILSHNFLQMGENKLRFEFAKIYNPMNIQEYKGKFKGAPFRTYVGSKYKGGFSDHFPVYSVFTLYP